MTEINIAQAKAYAATAWDERIIPTLSDYIEIECLSPGFDSSWQENGFIDEATNMFLAWASERPIKGMKAVRCDIDDRTPVILIEVDAQGDCHDGTVLMYGHLDKQPDMEGWEEGLHPRTPVIRDGKLYGRGGADDGYAMFMALTSIEILQEQGLPHGRLLILIEASEESGSPDLEAHVEALREQIGDVELVVCLDSGCGNYEQPWSTTSLRGVLTGYLTVRVLTEGVHSGSASGMVPDSSMLAHYLIAERLQSKCGLITLPELQVAIPKNRQTEAAKVAEGLDRMVERQFPWASDQLFEPDSRQMMLLNGSWMPTVTCTGVEGFPDDIGKAGNVLLPRTTHKLSFRLPPTFPAAEAADIIKKALERDPLPGTEVTFDVEEGHVASGWHARPTAPWLDESMEKGAQTFFGRSAMPIGEGGTIPLMGQLNDLFPDAQFLVTGVLGPNSNAHGPNEFLHLSMAENLTPFVSQVLLDHATR